MIFSITFDFNNSFNLNNDIKKTHNEIKPLFILFLKKDDFFFASKIFYKSEIIYLLFEIPAYFPLNII